MLHLCCYRSVTVAAVGFNKVDALEDGWLNEQDGAFIFPKPYDIYTWWMFRNDQTTRRFRLEASPWRDHGYPNFIPTNAREAASQVSDILPEIPRNTKITVPRLEPTYCYVEDVAGAALNTCIALWIGNQDYGIAGGETFTLKFTCSFAVQAGIWSSGVLTPEITLPSGRYQVIGMYSESPTVTLLMTRLIFQNQPYRPGVPVNFAPLQIFPNYWRYGHYGVLGEFDHTQVPIIELLGTSSNNEAPSIYLDLIKVR